MSGLLKSMPWASNRWPVLFGSPGGGRGWHGLLAKRSLDEVGEKESGLGWRERAGHRPFLRSSLTKEADKTPIWPPVNVGDALKGEYHSPFHVQEPLPPVEPLRFLTRRQKRRLEGSPGTHPRWSGRRRRPTPIRHRRHQFPRE